MNNFSIYSGETLGAFVCVHIPALIGTTLREKKMQQILLILHSHCKNRPLKFVIRCVLFSKRPTTRPLTSLPGVSEE